MSQIPLQVSAEGRYPPGANLEDPPMATVWLRGGIYHAAFTDYTGQRKKRTTGIREGPGRRKIAATVAADWELKHTLVRNGYLRAEDLVMQERGRVDPRTLLDEFAGLIRPGTWRTDGRNITSAFLEDARVHDVAAFGRIEIVGKAHAWLTEQARRRADRVRTLRRFGRFLWKRGLIEVNQLDRLDGAQLPADAVARIEHRALLPAEVERLGGLDLRGLLWRFRIWTGLRGPTVAALRRADLAFDDEWRAVLHVGEASVKNRQGWVIPLAPQLAASMREAVGMRHPDLPLFELPVRRETVAKWFRKDCKAASIEPRADVNLRSLRKTHHTILSAAGVDSDTRGTLRLDRDSGSSMLRRWSYTQPEQLVPRLRRALMRTESWYRRELKRAEEAAG